MSDADTGRRRIEPLLFATSNPAKFLQARLVLGRHGFEVKRLEAHRRPYREPYGLPTPQFLGEGINEVAARAGGNGLLFIEDTTVSFPALSEDGSPFPGQATKEWFAATVHEDLIKALDQVCPGERRAVVRSDVALRIPGLERPIIFSAWTEGEVVDRLTNLAPNDLYPWLGRPDFSSWFVPSGGGRVLAAMSIEESLKHDFRGKALALLAARLSEYEKAAAFVQPLEPTANHFRTKSDQLLLFPGEDSQMVLVVVGPPAAGKTTIGHYLAMYRDFTHIEGSRELTYAASQRGLRAPSSYELAGMLFEAHGFDAVERLSVIPMMAEAPGPVVYTGCRTLEGLNAVVKSCTDANRTLRILQVTAPLSVRLARANDRARNTAIQDESSLSEADLRDQSFGLLGCADLVADLVLRNDRDLSRLLEKLDEALPSLASGQRRENRRRDLFINAVANADPDEQAARAARLLPRSALTDELSPIHRARTQALLQILQRDDFS